MIERLPGLNPRRKLLIRAAILVTIGVVVYSYANYWGLSYRELIVVFSALSMGVIVFGGELGIRVGFVSWVFTLALGYRTMALTRDFAIHPAEVLLWLIVGVIFAQRQLISTTRLTFPLWLWLLVPFWVLAWWPSISGGIAWDRMLNEFRNFVLLIPLMIVVTVVLQHKQYWRYLLLAFFFTSSFIALMGVLEYWVPEVIRFFPAFVRNPAPSITQEGFLRANFSFWGGPPATFICVLAVPAAVVLTMWWRGRFQRAAIVAAAVLQIVAIYIGGYRSVWLILVIQILTTCMLRIRKQGAIVALLCIVFLVGGYELVPKTSERALSGIAILKGSPMVDDSSGLDRKGRALEALNTALESPYGSGWSSAGWVHSDFLQVTANLGIFAGLIFLGGYLYSFLRLGRRVLFSLRMGEGDLGLTLLLSMIAVGGILAMEGVTVLPQLALPVWFVWVLSEVWLRQTVDQPVFIGAVATTHAPRFAAPGLTSSLRTDG